MCIRDRPWSHTFGGNHNFNMVVWNGGTLAIDAGKPAPGLFQTTLENIKSVEATICFNVPRGYDMLVAALHADPELREKYFGHLQAIFYAAAALPRLLAAVVALLVLCAGLGWVISRLWHIDFLTAYLATNPGGADSVAIIATGLHLSLIHISEPTRPY